MRNDGMTQLDLAADEDNELYEDHRLLLRSSLPLLKSRNARVVLAFCSLHYSHDQVGHLTIPCFRTCVHQDRLEGTEELKLTP